LCTVWQTVDVKLWYRCRPKMCSSSEAGSYLRQHTPLARAGGQGRGDHVFVKGMSLPNLNDDGGWTLRSRVWPEQDPEEKAPLDVCPARRGAVDGRGVVGPAHSVV